MTNKIKQIFRADPDLIYPVVGIVFLLLFFFVINPIIDHFLFIELFGECACH